MREVTVSLGDKEVTLVANFQASVRIAKEVADPLFIFREAGIEFSMLQEGFNYQPKFMFTVENVPKILHIGMSAGGEKVKLEEAQELAFEAGFVQSRDACMEYLAAIVAPAPEELPEAKDDSPGE